MPRVIDFTQGNETDWNEVRLPSPVYGEREIRMEEFDALVKAFDAPVSGFNPQFSTYGKGVATEASAADFDAAHAWLSAHATGPWNWTEQWTNHGHHLDVYVYVERKTDQIAFAEAHSDLFGYRPEDQSIGSLAVTRGVLPVLTAKESFYVWSREHAGYRYLSADDLGEDGMRVVFDHAGLEAQFVEKWGAGFVVEDREEGRAYAGSLKGTNWRNSPSVWLESNAAVSTIAGGNTPRGYRWSVIARFDDVGEALQRDWGHVFGTDEGGRTFEAEHYPSTPTREIPDDFLAYIEGRAHTYEAPYLHELLKPFRAEAPSSSPRP